MMAKAADIIRAKHFNYAAASAGEYIRGTYITDHYPSRDEITTKILNRCADIATAMGKPWNPFHVGLYFTTK